MTATDAQRVAAERIALLRTRLAAMAAGNGTRKQMASQADNDLATLADLVAAIPLRAAPPPLDGPDRVYQLVAADGTVLGEDPAVPPGCIAQLPTVDVPCGVRRSTPHGGWQRGAWYPLGHPANDGILQWPDQAAGWADPFADHTSGIPPLDDALAVLRKLAHVLGVWDATWAVKSITEGGALIEQAAALRADDTWPALCRVLAAVGVDQQTLVCNPPAELATLAVDLLRGREQAAQATKLAQAMADVGHAALQTLSPEARAALRLVLQEASDALGRA